MTGDVELATQGHGIGPPHSDRGSATMELRAVCKNMAGMVGIEAVKSWSHLSSRKVNPCVSAVTSCQDIPKISGLGHSI